ncbi:tetratricopeptide repeat protein [Catenulispora sp. NL8]|uniref:Tetratricopeptide repeat protein n=1 Tax=Catenulispora pinistramenti TaxID=2705254 RepID=A0ABS5KLN4_9ACTN|nr:tetratricopeptide repeat protein [Catenulispora pinistramenti]MBS2546947.1 tetratricopeptide repeat protein [Catenulispora pinistramenti]
MGDRQGEAEILNSLAGILAGTARPHEALPLYRQALRLAREVRSFIYEAQAPEGAARCEIRAGAGPAALAGFREAIAIYRRIGAPEEEAARVYLAEAETA